jgi:hypothetical protein
MKLPQKNLKMKVAILGLVILLGCAANVQNKEDRLIQGTWILQDKSAINYPKIIFNNDSTAIFRSEGDTIYRFTYLLRNSHLVLQDLYGTQEIYEILRLNRDSLVFKSLRENQERQFYLRE